MEEQDFVFVMDRSHPVASDGTSVLLYKKKKFIVTYGLKLIHFEKY